MSENINIENNEVITENLENTGIVKISEDVIATIAAATLSGIEGVYGTSGSLAGGIVEFLGVKKSATKGIKVIIDEDGVVSSEIHITVKYGYKIPDVAWEIQEKVKAEIEAITGLAVAKINVHVDGINIEKTNVESEESTEEVTAETE